MTIDKEWIRKNAVPTVVEKKVGHVRNINEKLTNSQNANK